MKIFIFIITSINSFTATTCFGFDLEDYAGSYRDTRDAYKSAYNSMIIAEKNLILIVNFMRSMSNQVDTHQILAAGSRVHAASCGGSDAQKERAENKLIPELLSLTTDTIVKKIVDDPTQLKPASPGVGLYQDMQYYYSHLSPSLQNSEKALYEELSFSAYSQLNGSGYSANNQFDPEDYNATFRSNRDAYVSAWKNFQLGIAPYFAAKQAYETAVQSYINNVGCANFGGTKSVDEMIANGSL